jgi:hypothetical protein
MWSLGEDIVFEFEIYVFWFVLSFREVDMGNECECRKRILRIVSAKSSGF